MITETYLYTQNAQRHTEVSYITIPIILSWNITITAVHQALPYIATIQLFSYSLYANVHCMHVYVQLLSIIMLDECNHLSYSIVYVLALFCQRLI